MTGDAPTSVLVTGATGRQGGSVAERLLADSGYEVYGLTRSPESEAARSLERRGVTTVAGDLERPETLDSIPEAVDAVFCVTDFFSADSEAAERDQGVNAVAAAERLDVDHFVYSSAMCAERDTGVPHFESKFAVERRLERSSLDATVLRPAPYFQNLEEFRAAILAGFFPFPVAADVPIPLVDATDVGRAAADVFESPAQYAGEAYDVVACVRTPREIADALSDAVDVPVSPVRVPPSFVERSMGASVAEMYRWFEAEGVSPDAASSLDVTFTTLERYLRNAEWDGSGATATLGRLTAPLRLRLLS